MFKYAKYYPIQHVATNNVISNEKGALSIKTKLLS